MSSGYPDGTEGPRPRGPRSALVRDVDVTSAGQVAALDLDHVVRSKVVARSPVAGRPSDDSVPVVASEQHRMPGTSAVDGAAEPVWCGRRLGEDPAHDPRVHVRQVDECHQSRLIRGLADEARKSSAQRRAHALVPVGCVRDADGLVVEPPTAVQDVDDLVGGGSDHDSDRGAPAVEQQPHGTFDERHTDVVAKERLWPTHAAPGTGREQQAGRAIRWRRECSWLGHPARLATAGRCGTLQPMAESDVDFGTGAPVHGDLDVRWIHGARRRKDCTDPVFQVHAYDDHTYILRQSKAVTFEAPFLYLLFGNARALLLDTGAGKQSGDRPLRAIVDGLVEEWLAVHPRTSYELVVAHTHGHGDHVAGDAQFADRPATTVVGRELADVRAFFGFTHWPDETVVFDLGGRAIDVIATPGHHRAAVTLYDPWSGFLLTGDTVLPGRLYAPDVPAFVASLDKMVELAARRPVTHVMGCHVEMTRTPGLDYPLGCAYQPDEAPIQMRIDQLVSVRDAARSVAGQPGAHTFDDVIIMNGPARGYAFALYRRALWSRIRPRRH